MPVRFKGDSEYHTEYKWLESPKSASFTPANQQAAPIAGLTSPQTSQVQGFMDEPAILRKKKPIPLVTTSTTKMFDEDIVVPDDYMLLGSQEKFTPNVQYKDYLTKNRTRVLGTTYVTPAKPVDFEEMQPKKPEPQRKPLARINFDTGKRKEREQGDRVMEVNGTAKPLVLSKTRVIAKEPTSPVSPPHSFNNSAGQRPPNSKELMKAPRVSQPVPSAKEPTQSRLVEPAQENRRSDDRSRRTAKQDTRIDETYAMKYRAGVSPKRSNVKRRSEYTNNFGWKKPVESTPVLAAEQVIHNMNPQIGPYKVGLPKKSEYSKEFKAWKYKPVTSQDDSATRNQRRSLKGSQLRRTKSELDITPDRLPAAGSPSRVYHDNARLTQSLNPQKPFFPHRRTVSWTTEYKSNFQPFSSFEYDHGAWKGAAPPHIKQKMTYEPAKRHSESNWTAEVTELREKAEEYRKRSNGTHFSRAHVAQLLSDNSKLWDAVSVSSELSALGLEQSEASSSRSEEKPQRSQKQRPRQRTQSAQAALRSAAVRKVNESVQTGEIRGSGARKRLAWSSDGGRSTSPSDSARSICSSGTPTLTSSQGSYRPSTQKLANKQSQTREVLEQERSSQTSETTEDGRVQTPELAISPVANRHHLDVTTPNRHGMILSSPPHKHSSFQDLRGTKVTAKPDGGKRSNRIATRPAAARFPDNSQSLQVNIPRQQTQTTKPLISPTYGRPTQDTHALLNEDIAEPVDMILETRYVQSPQPKARNMTSLMEGAGMTYKVPLSQEDPWKNIPRRRLEEDECSDVSQLSNSMMSVISSTSSLASEVLERAEQRKQFWKKGKA